MKSYHVTKFEIGRGDNVDELKDLYNNAFSYAEGFGYNTSNEWKDLVKQSKDLLEELSSVLDDTQREKLEQLRSIYIKQTSIEIDRMFFYAFKRGARLVMDILTSNVK